jgi:hypothetical protein
MRNGRGVLIDTRGVRTECEWDDNRKTGKVTEIYPDGMVIVEKWYKGKKVEK